MNTKDVALVLSSGGPRGWAYIGAIEELISRGYNITSVAGTSMKRSPSRNSISKPTTIAYCQGHSR